MSEIILDFNNPELHKSIILDDTRFQVLNAGRKFGKTKIIHTKIAINNYKQHTDSLKNILPPRQWYIAPTYKQGREIFWEWTCKVLEPIIWKKNETRLEVKFTNGGHFAIKGSEDPDSLRGPYLTAAYLDEYAHHKNRATIWQAIILPMLVSVDPPGSALFPSTPDGYNEFHDLFLKGNSETETDWKSWQFKTVDGGFVGEDYVEAAKADMDLDTWRQEFLAEFVGKAGRVYYAFDRETHCKQVNFVPELEILWFWDFNVNPACHSGLAHRHKGQIYVFDEICVGETPDNVNEFMRRYPPESITGIKLYGDYTGNISTTGITDYQTIRKMLYGAGYPVPELKVYGGNPLERDRTNNVNRLLKNALEQSSITINPERCPKLIKDFENVKRSEKNGKIDKTTNPYLTHISDAFGYMSYVEFPPRDISSPLILEDSHHIVNPRTGWWA